MPKPPAHALIWTPERAAYELWTLGRSECLFHLDDEPSWTAWLEQHDAFSFRGQRGSLNALKERRQRGQGYWYGYRGLARRTIKRYLGPATRLSLTRLEEVASAFEQTQARPNASSDPVETEQRVPSLSRSLKFRPPPLREHLIERPELVQLLERCQTSGLTLLSAPAGCGKTTLISQWLAASRHSERIVAWLSLDERDNGIVAFWRSMIRACEGVLGEHAQPLLAQLTTLEGSPSLLEEPILELVLASLLDGLAARSRPAMIVLEDYQYITLPQVHTSLAFWLEHLPPYLRVIMLTRHDPPLPLAQWRVHGILYEMRSDTLRFTSDETILFFQYHSLHTLTQTDMLQLLERTEGWIAGIQLAVLVLNAQGTEKTVHSALQGNHRYIADYLIQEVLNHLPEHVKLFLQQTSLLEQLQGRLCEAVTGQPGGPHMLTWLERANLFIVPLDEQRQWYRYHHLFREVLLQHLSQNSPAFIAELHRRAARWFLHEGMFVEAITHAQTAGDFVTLAESIEQSQSTLLEQGENSTLFSWLHLLPPAVLFERLPLFLLACMENMAVHRVQVAAELLNTYAHLHHLPSIDTHDIDELEHALCVHTGQRFPLPQDEQRRAAAVYGFLGFYATLALIVEHDIVRYRQIRQRSERYIYAPGQRRQENWLTMLLQGDIQGAIADLMRNLTESTTRYGNTVLFAYQYPTLTTLLTATGQLPLVESLARRMLQRRDTLDARLNHGPALIDLGRVAYERNQLAQAEVSIKNGLPLCQYPGTEVARYLGRLLLAKIRRIRGDSSTAWAILQELEQDLAQSALETNVLKNWRGLLAWEALELGTEDYAQLWLQDNPVTPDFITRLNPLSANIFMTQAFFLLRFARRAEAETLLSSLHDWAKRLKLDGMLIAVLALQAILAQSNDEHTQATRLLHEALLLAEPSEYTRTFLDLGEQMQTLLLQLWNQHHTAKQDSSIHSLRRLLAAIKGEEYSRASDAAVERSFSQPLIEPLSQREQEVLRAINAGYSNQEIARRLVISSSTVKSHINSIYRKLQTRSRTQAIARAQALHLFPQ